MLYIRYWFIETIFRSCNVFAASVTFIFSVTSAFKCCCFQFWVRNVYFAMYIFKRTCIFAWNFEIILLADNTIHALQHLFDSFKKPIGTPAFESNMWNHKPERCLLLNVSFNRYTKLFSSALRMFWFIQENYCFHVPSYVQILFIRSVFKRF
jgi:hypothetical protein